MYCCIPGWPVALEVQDLNKTLSTAMAKNKILIMTYVIYHICR